MKVHQRFVSALKEDYNLPFHNRHSEGVAEARVVRDADGRFVAQCATEALAVFLADQLNASS